VLGYVYLRQGVHLKLTDLDEAGFIAHALSD
jgi:hypothetical protein